MPEECCDLWKQFSHRRASDAKEAEAKAREKALAEAKEKENSEMQTTNQASDKGSVDDSGHVRVPVVIEEDEETPPEDPLVVEARTAANKECDKVRWFTDLKALKEQLKIEVLASSHSVVFLQDAQTSRFKINSTYLENIGELVQELDLRRWAVVVILGSRFDLVDPLVKRGQTIFKSNGRVMLCQLTPGKLQGKKIKGNGLPSSCIVVHPIANAPDLQCPDPLRSCSICGTDAVPLLQ